MSKNITSKLRLESLTDIEAKNANQQKAFDSWDKGKNLILNGSPGTGKTFIAMHMALEDVLAGDYDRCIIVRSAVPSRDIGFLPGTEEEKFEVYAAPYIDLASEIFSDKNAWLKLKAHDQVAFQCTSFVRGRTWDNAVVIVDEMQNLNWGELNTVLTRIGGNSKVILCGDYYQSDFTKESENSAILEMLKVLRNMNSFDEIEFTWKDIVRSDFVRDFIITKESMYRRGELTRL